MKKIKFLIGASAVPFLLAAALASENQQDQNTAQQSNLQQVAEGNGVTAEEWIRIGYDYDGDNIIDAYEYIFAVDLENARKQTQQRAKEKNLTVQEAGSQYESQKRIRQISGTIQETMETKLAQQDQKHLIARIRTEDDWPIIADLGPVSQIRQLNLSEGDKIEMKAKPAFLNQRRIYLATEIDAEGKKINVVVPSGEGKVRLFGTIDKTETKTLEGKDTEPHLIALIELDSGSRVPVDFGRKKDLEVDLSSGKKVALIAEPVTVGGKRILVAHSVGIDGKQYEIEWLKEYGQQVSKTR